MTRYFLPAFLVITGCSTLDPLEKNPFEERVGSDTAEIEDTSAETGIDDTAAEDTTDTAEIDTASDEDTAENSGDTAEDTAAEVCDFPFVDAGGYTVSLGNELSVALENDDPEVVTSNSAETTRFRLSSLHAGCDTLVITEIPVEAVVTDNDGTDWAVTTLFILDDETRSFLMTGELEYNEDGDLVTRLDGVLVIPPGASKSFVISLNPTGAAEGDKIRIDILPGMQVYDHNNWVYYNQYDRIEGGELTL